MTEASILPFDLTDLTAPAMNAESCAGEFWLLAARLQESAVRAVLGALQVEHIGANVLSFLSAHDHQLLRLRVSRLPTRVQCRTWSDRFAVDCAAVTSAALPKALVFDMDSTLITMEVIDELAKEANAGEQVAAITEAAMRGELDFNASLRQRVGALKGLSISALQQVRQRLQFNAGVPEFARYARDEQIFLAVVSGGFVPFAEAVQKQLQFDFARANTLHVEDDCLTGQVLGEIVNGQIKQQTLEQLRDDNRWQTSQVWAVGDGANDAAMLAASGLGVAFRAKPALRAQATVALDHADMRALATIIDSLKAQPCV